MYDGGSGNNDFKNRRKQETMLDYWKKNVQSKILNLTKPKNKNNCLMLSELINL